MLALRSDLAANWFAANPVLGFNEAVVESDTARVKVGDGATPYVLLPYANLAPADALKAYPPAQVDPTATGVAPTLTQGAQAASVAVGSGLSDAGGSVTATALATGMAAGQIVTVTFSVPYAAAPRAIVLSETSAVTVGLYVSARSATGFTVSSRSAATASQALGFDFHVLG